MNSPEAWVTLVVAGIAAAGAVAAAIVAGVFARRTNRADVTAQRIRELESRNSERKFATYEPMIEYLGEIFSKQETPEERAKIIAQGGEKFKKFSTWITIYGSDGAVRAFHNFMQAAYQGDAPPAISLRLYGEFLVEARKDMGHPESTLQLEHLIGIRVNDIYKTPDVIDPSFAEICDRLNWKPPWLSPEIAPHDPD